MRYVLLISICILYFYFGCTDNPVGPGYKDPRTYTWRIDTLVYPGSFQTLMRSIWGSSPKDVYVVGHNSSPGPGTMFRFDGKSWNTTGFHAAEGGTISGAISLHSMYGFGPDNIFAVGDHIAHNPDPPPNFLSTSLIIHYDGTQWIEYKVDDGDMLLTVWGTSVMNVWAGGAKGTLYKYDGSSWDRFIMPDTISIRSINGLSEDDVYAIAYKLGPVGLNTFFLYHWDGVEWSLEETFTESVTVDDPFGKRKIVSISGTLYSAGNGIFRKTSSGWERMFGDRFTGFQSVCGISPDNFFAVGNYGLVYHFNGSNWYQFSQFVSNDIHFRDCWTDGREVFIVGFGGGEIEDKSFVLHGK